MERVALRADADFWSHYIVESDGRQMWQADFESLAEAVAGARQSGGRRVLLDDAGHLTQQV